jgi:CO/xanthine dehydrogenase FAD-binding subunit
VKRNVRNAPAAEPKFYSWAAHSAQQRIPGGHVDLNTVIDVVRRPSDRPGADWSTGDAWLAGGTWLFSEPQPTVRRLVDLTQLGWPSLVPLAEGLEIAATCTISELHDFLPPNDWLAGGLLRTSCEAFLASFKVWNAATVGGNICMSLPAGPMITMTVALEAAYHLWAADGTERTVAAEDFVLGNHLNVLRPGEILRSVHIPNHALRRRCTHRRFTLTKLGRSTIFLVATQTPATDDLMLTITAGTTRPVVLRFNAVPDADTLQEHIDAIPTEAWFADPNGTPDHRRHLAKHYAEEIRVELGGVR